MLDVQHNIPKDYVDEDEDQPDHEQTEMPESDFVEDYHTGDV